MTAPHYFLTAALCLLAAATVLLMSCSLYHKEFRTAPPQGTPYELFVVQADDFGSLWSVPLAQQVLDHVTELAKSRNLTVVVFIHGWHHNGAPDDPNYQDFQKRLAAVDRRLNLPHFQRVRAAASGESHTHVIGIYVAWRGRALPDGLDYFTMWSRKSAAERVGDGDVREFILRLQRTYLRANSIHVTAKVPRPHMGLITFGHSFGAQVLLKTLAATMERSLTERTLYLAPLVEPPVSPPSSGSVHVPIDSFGDINILINPATESYQYARIDALARELRYPWCQLPQILVLSSDKDTPRRSFFPIARALTRPFRPAFRSSEQGALWGTALGMLESQKTHLLLWSNAPASLEDADYDSDAGRQKILHWDFTSVTSLSQVTLQPRPDVPAIANTPVMVATEPGVLIRDHNDIFQDRLWDFMLDYVSFLEGKRLLTQELRLRQDLQTGTCPELPQS